MGRDHAWTFLFQDKMISNASDGSNDPADIDQSDEKNYKNVHEDGVSDSPKNVASKSLG